MKQLWSIFTVLTLLAVRMCKGEKSCVIWSSAGRVVQRTSPFRVFCTFNYNCSRSMYSGHPPREQAHSKYNATTIYLDVVNLKEDGTYSCDCFFRKSNSDTKPDSCGLDISAGYPPDAPTNFSCIYKVADTHYSSVVCTWSSGRDTYLRNNSSLWVQTYSHNVTGASELYNVSVKGTASPSAVFTVDSSVHVISVWAHIQNQLGFAVSSVINYTLSDIMMPPVPVLRQVECSSRNCTIRVEQLVKTQHLEINYKSERETWMSYPHSVGDSALVLIPLLQPYTLYQFRARSRFSTGHWSEWSATISNWTQEEAPARELDVWYTVDQPDKSIRVYWKEADVSVALGKIVEYIVTVCSQNSPVSADARSHSVAFVANCEVTVCARNSKGLSPPAKITTRHSKAKPPGNVKVTTNNRNVTISWTKAESAPIPSEYVVEWYPHGQRLDQLRWVRVSGNSSGVVITDMKPFVCYEGAVYVFYSEKSVGKTTFTGLHTDMSVPTAGPFLQERVKGNTVNVTWSELSVPQRRGCIIVYTIYLENSSRHQTSYNVSASQKFWVLRDLSPAIYSIWMTASTAKGEGRAGQKVKFFIQQDSQLPLLLTCGVLVLILLLLLCLCQSSAVKQRFWVYFQCLMLDVIPDPANSKWAKECIQEKGKVELHLQLSNSTVTESEEDPILVDIQELPKQSGDNFPTADVSFLLCPQAGLRSDSEPSSPVYPPTTYIKSLSHNSDSSDNTHTSLETNTTEDYISSHETEGMFEEENEDIEDILCFFHSPVVGQMDYGLKLTLDAVRIGGSEFFNQCD